MDENHAIIPALPFLSVVVIAGMEEMNIGACLETAIWADEIVVVHSSRADRTAEIAREYTDVVHFREFDTFSAQRLYALGLASNPWVFVLDADERILPELHVEIKKTLSNPGENCGFLIPRRGYFLGKWLRHGGWYPDYQLRLFRRDRVRVSERLVHEGYIVDGPVGRFSAAMDHFTDPTIHHHLLKNVEYCRLEALERRKRVHAADLLLHPISAFFRAYFGRGGWRDGSHGLAAALIHATYTLQQYLFMWELGRGSKGTPGRSSTPEGS